MSCDLGLGSLTKKKSFEFTNRQPGILSGQSGSKLASLEYGFRAHCMQTSFLSQKTQKGSHFVPNPAERQSSSFSGHPEKNTPSAPCFVISAEIIKKQYVRKILRTGRKASNNRDACSSSADCSRDSACVLRSSNSKAMVWPSLYVLEINSLDIGFGFRDLFRPPRH